MRDSNVVSRKALVVHLPILPVVRMALACLDLCSVGQGAARLYHGGSPRRMYRLVLQLAVYSIRVAVECRVGCQVGEAIVDLGRTRRRLSLRMMDKRWGTTDTFFGCLRLTML